MPRQPHRRSSSLKGGTSLGLAVLGTAMGVVDSRQWFFLVLASLVMMTWHIVEVLGSTFVILALSHRKGLTGEQYLTLVRAVLRSQS